MYAVVEIQGSHFKVEKDQKLFVNRIDAKEGSKISFDNVLLIDDGNKVQVGKPNLSGTSVEAKVVAHKKDDKVILTGFRVGEAFFGGFAQYAKVDANFLIKIQKNVFSNH